MFWNSVAGSQDPSRSASRLTSRINRDTLIGAKLWPNGLSCGGGFRAVFWRQVFSREETNDPPNSQASCTCVCCTMFAGQNVQAAEAPAIGSWGANGRSYNYPTWRAPTVAPYGSAQPT